MKIDVYGKAGCGKCEACKKKLGLLGLRYESHDLGYHSQPHDGWRDDGSVDARAAWEHINDLPIIKIDGEFFTYSQGMKILRGKK